ncbi:MAG: YggT family protein [Heyndrickxia sp.]
MSLIISLLVEILNIYSYVIIIYIFMSWFNAQQTSLGSFFARICEPYLEQFRRIIPPLGMIDISPIVALIVLQLARGGLHQIQYWLI